MIPCPSCKRHAHDRETSCPFCGTSLRQASSPLRELVGVLIVGASLIGTSACSTEGDEGSSSGMTTESSSSESASTETETGMMGTETGMMGTETGAETGTETTDDSTNTSGGFYGAAEDFFELSDCDPFALECPEGDKCVPAKAGAHHCVPVLGELGIGEPCSRDANGATDDCGQDSYCADGVCSFIDAGGDPRFGP